MNKKPIWIIIIGWAYILKPVFYYLSVCIFFNISPFNTRHIFATISSIDVSLSLMSVIVGISILQVNIWAWYIFLIHALGLIFWNSFVAWQAQNPGLTWLTVLAGTLTLAFIGAFLFRQIREPFFNPRIRWWERKKRYGLNLPTILKIGDVEMKGETLDLSASGLYFVGEITAKLGECVEVIIDYETLREFKLQGEIVRISDGKSNHPKGGGVRFRNQTSLDLFKFRREIKKLFKVK